MAWGRLRSIFVAIRRSYFDDVFTLDNNEMIDAETVF